MARHEPGKGSLKMWRIGVWMMDDGLARITCPNCEQEAVVNGTAWRDASTYKTRPCTYCFKTAKVPT